MIVNELKPLLGERWKEKFVHRDLWDPEGYGVASFDLGGEREKVLAMNLETEDIMEYFFDDFPDDEWISLDRVIELRGSAEILSSSKTKYFLDRKDYLLKRSSDVFYEDYITDLFLLGRKESEAFNVYPQKKLYHKLTIPIHVLVSVLLVPNPSPDTYTIVNHINGDRRDFKKENLEWCDYKWNSNPKNKRQNSSKSLYKCIDTGIIYNRTELIRKYSASAPSTIWKSIEKGTTYRGHHWKIFNPTLEDYLSRHPLREDWYQHPTMSNVRANGCGVLEVDGKLRIGTLNSRYYIVGVSGAFFRAHRLLYECFSGELLTNSDIVDHIVPVSAEDCNNSKENLRKVDHVGNMNNSLTIKKHEKRIMACDFLGNILGTFDSISIAARENNVKTLGISTVVSGREFSYKGKFWAEDEDFESINYKQSFLYSRWSADRKVLDVSIEFSKVQPIKKHRGGSEYLKNKKYLNTGMPAPDGFYYQQGDPQHMIYDPENTSLEKKRPEIFWKDRNKNNNKEGNQ